MIKPACPECYERKLATIRVYEISRGIALMIACLLGAFVMSFIFSPFSPLVALGGLACFVVGIYRGVVAPDGMHCTKCNWEGTL